MNTDLFEKIINNRVKIPSKYWKQAENGNIVVWLLDREDGTAGDYETSQERLGITIEGEILWGFSSGCSCWDGWDERDYEKTVTYKEFIIRKEDLFEKGWDEEVNKTLLELNEIIDKKDCHINGVINKIKEVEGKE